MSEGQTMNTAGKVSQILTRSDGSEVKIVAEKFFGLGLTSSIGVFVLRRENPAQPWKLTSDRPHPDWRKMPVAEYVKRGRSEMLQTVSHAEILRVTSALAATGM